MSDTQARLDAYKAAELRILGAQEVRHGDRSRRNAELEIVRKAIKELEGQLSAELNAANGGVGPRVMVAGFNRALS